MRGLSGTADGARVALDDVLLLLPCFTRQRVLALGLAPTAGLSAELARRGCEVIEWGETGPAAMLEGRETMAGARRESDFSLPFPDRSFHLVLWGDGRVRRTLTEARLKEIWRVVRAGGRACLLLENDVSLAGPGRPRLGMPIWPRARALLLSVGFRWTDIYGLFPYLGRNQALVPLDGRGPLRFFLSQQMLPAVSLVRATLLWLLMWTGVGFLVAPWYLVIAEKPLVRPVP